MKKIMSDPKQGGSLSDMAPEGTSIPSDAGTQRTIPSVPNPHQAAPSASSGADLAGAASNAADIPRSGRDVAPSGEVVTGTYKPFNARFGHPATVGIICGTLTSFGKTAYGDSMPAEIETKRLGMQSGMMDAAKGHGRDEKHRKQKGADEERLAGEGPEVAAAPGEEDEDQEVLRDRRE